MEEAKEYFFDRLDYHESRKEILKTLDKSIKDGFYPKEFKTLIIKHYDEWIEEYQKLSKFDVTFEETVSQTFSVRATDNWEAQEIAIKKYNDGKYIVENPECHQTLINVYDSKTQTSTGWVEI